MKFLVIEIKHVINQILCLFYYEFMIVFQFISTVKKTVMKMGYCRIICFCRHEIPWCCY